MKLHFQATNIDLNLIAPILCLVANDSQAGVDEPC